MTDHQAGVRLFFPALNFAAVLAAVVSDMAVVIGMVVVVMCRVWKR